MRKTTQSNAAHPLTVDIHKLMEMLCCGEVTARKIGEEAGAKICIGRRVLYRVCKIEEYLDDLSDN